MALGPDSSVFVVGGTTPMPMDLGSIQYRDFWLTSIDSQGSIVWADIEEQDLDQSPGLTIARDGDGVLTTLSTEFVEGPRTHLRRDSPPGRYVPSDEWLDPELTVARALPNEAGVWLGGAELVGETGGRPFLQAHIDREGAASDSAWPATFAGLEGSVSAVIDMALDDAGYASVSGYLGIDAESNRSVPWVARLAPDGRTVFQTSIAVSDDQHCSADSVAVTRGGVTLATGYCEGNWLKAFSPEGTLLWERRFPRPITAIAASDTGGYFVATGVAPDQRESFNPNDDFDEARAELLAFDAEHHLEYRAVVEGCAPFHRLLVAPEGVFGLGRCLGDMLLAKYQAP